MSKGVSEFLSCSYCQPRLPDATRPGQRDQGYVGTQQQRLEGRDLRSPSHEGSQESRQVGTRVSVRDEVNHPGR